MSYCWYSFVIIVALSITSLHGGALECEASMELGGSREEGYFVMARIMTGEKEFKFPLGALYDRSNAYDVRDAFSGERLPNHAGGGGPGLMKKMVRLPETSDVTFVAGLPRNEVFMLPKPGIFEVAFAWLPGEPMILKIGKDGVIRQLTKAELKEALAQHEAKMKDDITTGVPVNGVDP